MTKFTIALEDDYEFELIGISCHSKNYKLCFTVNQAIHIALKRTDDFDIVKKKETLSFPFYEYLDEECGLNYFLIANKSEKGFLVSEKQTVDYFLILKGNISPQEVKKIEKALQNQPIILMAYQIDVASLKSKKNLLF